MDQIVDPRSRAQMEYSAQFFGFSPDSFIDTILGDCAEIVSGNLQSAKKRCLEAFEGKVPGGEVDKCFAEAEEKYLEVTERIFYRFGCYLRSQVLTVPPEILLPEDEVHSDPERTQYDGADLHSAEDKFRNLCQKVRNAKLERAVLRNKVKNLEEVHKRLEVVSRSAKEIAGNEKLADQIAKKAKNADKKSRSIEMAIENLERGLRKKRLSNPEQNCDLDDKRFKSDQ